MSQIKKCGPDAVEPVRSDFTSAKKGWRRQKNPCYPTFDILQGLFRGLSAGGEGHQLSKMVLIVAQIGIN
jgi:hypothetical protein